MTVQIWRTVTVGAAAALVTGLCLTVAELGREDSGPVWVQGTEASSEPVTPGAAPPVTHLPVRSAARTTRPGTTTLPDRDDAAAIDGDEAKGEDGSGSDPRFTTCAEATTKGFGPYVQGADPEYDWYPDPDNDGTVCE
ncbi:nuclease [Actinoplanes sp. SE50]|uniref:excalibur calcium-binding domain-containing protein n=1 Tax=unclassified Actinoplanes TaxID=2626549 RepID=UPI00023ED015|nr:MULTISPECIES: excalibur calcium-binding domain-containing protein [unclassified Actinoplanes]AEV83275.1 nuclease [Actinoplanes sp. SE50/110]ATO81668.1 nuclease [Actinoplanes sp. SE50]SLL99076.1 hypothetical protein ACSP50_2304 [Actinoplanes sp. SE50/110]